MAGSTEWGEAGFDRVSQVSRHMPSVGKGDTGGEKPAPETQILNDESIYPRSHGLARRMLDARKTLRARVLVVLGFGSAAVGAALMCFATFQTRGPTISGLTGAAPVTLTFTHLPWYPATGAFLALVMAIPVWSGYLRWKFHLTTIVAPALVAMGMLVWVYQNLLGPGAGSIVVASALWVVFGIASIFFGCVLEILGVILARRYRTSPVERRTAGTAHRQRVVSPPR